MGIKRLIKLGTTIFYIFVLFSFFYQSLWAYKNTSFLSHGPSVACLGRGETTACNNSDISSSFYNPAFLLNNEKGSINFTHFRLFEGSVYNFFGISRYYQEGKALGLSFVNLRSGEIEIRKNINDTPKNIYAYSWAFILDTATKLEKPFLCDFGINIRYVFLDMLKYSSGAFSVDIGLSKRFKGPIILNKQSIMLLGCSIQNILQQETKLMEDEESYPSIIRVSGSISMPIIITYLKKKQLIFSDNLSILTDILYDYQKIATYLGLEYALIDTYFIRLGYYPGHTTFGLGYKFKNWQFNYAVDFSDLTLIHRIGVSLFISPKNKKTKSYTYKIEKDTLLKEALIKQQEEKDKIKKIDMELDPIFKSAQKDYKDGKYLRATNKLKEIIIKYPEYEKALKLYENISKEMNKISSSNYDPNLEKLSYAKGYNYYFTQNYEQAILEWSKILQINPNNEEILEYSNIVKINILDTERQKQEKLLDEKIKKIYECGINYFNQKDWILCIKYMEQIQEICQKESFPSSMDWNKKAKRYISRSIKELSKIKTTKLEEPKKELESPIDINASDKKYNEGLILYAQGKLSTAIKMWEISVRLNPQNEKAKKALQRISQELNQSSLNQ